MTVDVSAPRWSLTLYVSGASPRSTEAIETVRRICDEDLADQVDLVVVNAVDHPALVKRDHILALPTLVRHAPEPLRYLVGNLSDGQRVRSALDLDLAAPVPAATSLDEGPARMTAEDGFEDESALETPSQQIVHLQETLTAISSGGVDAVVGGRPEEEQVYTLTSADRPYRVIVERMGEGAATVSERGVILFANPQLALSAGVDRDGMVGRDLTDYVDEDQKGVLEALMESRATETRRAELAIRRTDGLNIRMLVAATALDIEGVLVRCLVFTDLTMQKRVEQQVAEEAAQAERQRVAREVNDTIVQGLVTAEMALDLKRFSDARKVIASTSGHARRWIGELAVDHQVQPGSALRSSPARSDPEPE